MLAFLEGPEAIVVIVALLLVVGANRVPKLARQLGQAQRELKRGMQEGFGSDDAAGPDTTPAAGVVTPETTEATAAAGPDAGAPRPLPPPLPPPTA